MIDADATLDVTVTCDQCKTSDGGIKYPDPWSTYGFESDIEDVLQDLIEDGWEIENEDALCPDCVRAREEDEEPLDPYRDNGGIAPQDGIGLKLFDE